MILIRQMCDEINAIYVMCAKHERAQLSLTIGQTRSPNPGALRYTTVHVAAKVAREAMDARRERMLWGWHLHSGEANRQWREAEPDQWWFNFTRRNAWIDAKTAQIEMREIRAREEERYVGRTCALVNGLAKKVYDKYGIDWKIPNVLVGQPDDE